jgi:hypothetical protein
MSHDIHAGDPAQILHDSCGECQWRSEHPDAAISHLDVQSFADAWKRAAAWGRDGLADVSHAEVPVLRVLWATAVQFERLGFPVGQVPYAPATALLAAAGVAL